jgi:hypothetical protein
MLLLLLPVTPGSACSPAPPRGLGPDMGGGGATVDPAVLMNCSYNRGTWPGLLSGAGLFCPVTAGWLALSGLAFREPSGPGE